MKTTSDPGAPPVPPPARRALPWLIFGLVALLVVCFLLVELNLFPLTPAQETITKKLLQAGTLLLLFAGLRRLLLATLARQVPDVSTRYNLARIVDLTLGLVLFFILLTLLFANWYTAAVSLGLLSLIIGFALQTPITSFIGWIYILLRRSYRVGDRIKVGDIMGDVLDLNYLDTTLLECRGDYLTGDHPSGRIVTFPNLIVLSAPVYNYTAPAYPYIWNEIKLHVAYQSDLTLVARLMTEATERELGPALHERIDAYHALLKRTTLAQAGADLRPLVFFAVNDNTWVEVVVRYPVRPAESEGVRTRLLHRLLADLNAQEERVQFPKSNMR